MNQHQNNTEQVEQHGGVYSKLTREQHLKKRGSKSNKNPQQRQTSVVLAQYFNAQNGFWLEKNHRNQELRPSRTVVDERSFVYPDITSNNFGFKMHQRWMPPNHRPLVELEFIWIYQKPIPHVQGWTAAFHIISHRLFTHRDTFSRPGHRRGEPFLQQVVRELLRAEAMPDTLGAAVVNWRVQWCDCGFNIVFFVNTTIEKDHSVIVYA